jgi:hypothetical protein
MKNDIDTIAKNVGSKIGKDIDKLVKRAQKLLSPLGLDIKIIYVTHELGSDPTSGLTQPTTPDDKID